MELTAGVPHALPLDAPLDPDAAEARRLLMEELAKTRYQEQAGEAPGIPDWLQALLDRIDEFLNSLGGEGTAPVWVLVLVVVGIALVVAAFLVFGVPRLRARSAGAGEGLFEADDVRDAAAIRRAADAAARAGDFALAIAERFRAVARSLHERTLVSTVPGSTSHDVARRAALVLPAHGEALERAAHDFDAVRYLGDPGDRERYATLVELDEAVARTHPDLAAVGA
ncbi:DUF4129 domain-containing protein [Protaetiibacter larvae]|uniref:DUF4129 domain-containing protein n=1 Tax=Protaetiibacter larvae TaxID=2592654 RepID=A0A5C1Y497_9MICO|nr:DUF4129 domain-containing protein [Protaetiibacter larvae]QEO08586.1 DUF4129 domain-containing protein [Protaetiibacter larvae]